MAGLLRARAIARWLLGAVAVAGGGYVLALSWATFNGFAVTRSLAYPYGWHAEIMFWYALPGFQAGLLAGLLPYASRRGIGRLLLVANLVVWTEIAVNVGIILYLISRDVLF